jgi:hypothetical protein
MTAKREDPILRSSRREAIVVFAIWAIACVYSVGYCYWFGYYRSAESLRYFAGIPDWVFVGLVVPWTLCTMLSFWISNYFMSDDDLGEEQPEAELHGNSRREVGDA